jgi:uncharacterized protein (TIGR02145 family)
MKSVGTTYWNSPNTGATNESGFSALPGGFRDFSNGSSYNIGEITIFLSSSDSESFLERIWSRILNYSSGEISKGASNKNIGYSIRCLRG